MNINYSKEQIELLHNSTFSDLDEINRFVEWYRKENQIHSDWDTHRYVLAIEFLHALDMNEYIVENCQIGS